MTTIEVCAGDLASVRAAELAGAARVELCSALELGGITPSAGLIEAALDIASNVEIWPIIRPRGGDFVCSDDELRVMEADIRLAIEAGCAGVVIGVLTRGGEIARDQARRLIAAATDAGGKVAWHRAIDHAADPLAALAELGALGVVRVLTSGGVENLSQASVAQIAALRAAAPSVQIMAGGGLRLELAAALVNAGAHALHSTCKPALLGPGGGALSSVAGTDSADVRVIRALRAVSSH